MYSLNSDTENQTNFDEHLKEQLVMSKIEIF